MFDVDKIGNMPFRESKFEKPILKEEKEIDYSQGCLVGLKIEEPVIVKKDALPKATEIEAKKVKAGKTIFWLAKKCQVEEFKAGTKAFWGARKSLSTKKAEAQTIGERSLGVVILGEVIGKVFPSVILMKGKLEKEEPEQIETFFKEELKNSQQGKESIFDPLCYFNWEGETLEEGEKKLKERYNRIKDKKELLGELEKYYFYLFSDNLKREEIFSGFEKLRKIEKETLFELNDYLPQLEKVKNYLSLLFLKDWLGLGQYAEFLDFKEEKFKEIEKSFEKLNLEKILKEPEKFEDLNIAKKIKQLKVKGEIKKDLIEKEFQKEIKNKKTHLIREELLNSPKENLKAYIKKLGIKEEINEDIVFAVRLHKILTMKEKEKNKEILEQLIKGKKPIDWPANKDWLTKMKKKLNTDEWLKPYSKKYSPLINEDYKASLETGQKKHKEEILAHLKEAGIELLPEIEVQEIEKIFSEKRKEIPQEVQLDIKTHFRAIKSFGVIEKSKLPEKLILESEEEPLKTIQMGQRVIGSCLRLKGGHEESAVCNAVDINKKVIWAKNEKGEILGRVLVGVTEKGKLAGFRIYNNDPRLNLEPCFSNFLSSLAKELKTELTLKGKIEELVGKDWYNDGIIEWKK